ncbi:MAG: YtxH domain-containing protein [Endomicrobiia bacterium]
MSENNSGNTVLSFLLGVVTGAILGILFAPAEGKQTRKVVSKYLEDLEEKGEELVEDGKKFVESGTKKVKDFVDDSKDKIIKRFSKESATEE